MIFIIKGFRTIVFIFIVMSFIESTGVTCSDSVNHNQVQVLRIPVTHLQSGLNLQPPDDWHLRSLGNQHL